MSKRKTTKLKHSPYLSFKAYLVENGIKLQDVAYIVGCSKNSVCQKNNGYQDYTMTEINKICDHYGISSDIFRAKKVS